MTSPTPVASHEGELKTLGSTCQLPKTALITGSSGISAAAARKLLPLGYTRFVLGYLSNQASAEELKKRLEAAGANVVLVQGNLSAVSPMHATLGKFFAAIDKEFDGHLTSFVHSAGAYFQGTEEETQEMYNTIYPRFFALAVEQALTRMQDGDGKIVAVSSPGCNLSMSPRVTYPAGSAKAAMEYQVRMLAKKLCPRRINVNGVIPGITNTKGWTGERKALEQMAVNRCPMRVLLEPDHQGDAIAWLCSEQAAAVTGVLLPVDGGLHFV